MIRVAISVEGQTEDEFCKRLLVPFFRAKDKELKKYLKNIMKNTIKFFMDTASSKILG